MLPTTLNELLHRAHQFAGLTLHQLAHHLHPQRPQHLAHHKGGGGQLMEQALGLPPNSHAGADLPHLGVELKTIPITPSGQVCETTYVCTVPLRAAQRSQTFADSLLAQKLRHVLWIPLLHQRQQPLLQRRIGLAFLWQPNQNQWQQLHNDWQEIINVLCRGDIGELTARCGEYVQVRPKAAHARVTTDYCSDDHDDNVTLPRGFYLRIPFTQTIINEQLQRNK